MKINSPGPLFAQGINSPQKNPSTYQQVAEFSHQSDLTITTKEGDKVSLSQAFGGGTATSLTTGSLDSPLQTFTSTSLQYSNFSFEVQGDLNEQELEDIHLLIDDLGTIAEDFFAGDVDQAIKGAFQLGTHMGSLTEVSASFTRTSMLSTYSSNTSHPLPPLGNGQLVDLIEQEERPKDVAGELLRAQWEQVLTMLEQRDEEPKQNSDSDLMAKQKSTKQTTSPPPFAVAALEANDRDTMKNSRAALHAEKMMERINDTLTKHPRLSPLATPIADLSIEKAAEKIFSQAEKASPTNLLKENFMREFDDWFYI